MPMIKLKLSDEEMRILDEPCDFEDEGRPHSSLDGLTPREYHQRSREDQTLNGANQ